MATLHLDNIPNRILVHIQQLAKQNNCSISQTAVALIQRGLEEDNFTSKIEENPCIIKTIKESSERRERLSNDIQLLDSTELIREDRAS